METVQEVKLDKRAEYIKGLRALADVLENNPDLNLPFSGQKASSLNVIPHSGDEQREQLAAWVKVLPGRRDKSQYGADGKLFGLVGALHGIHIEVLCDRNEVCEKVVTGTREVTKEVPDPEALAAVPKVTVTETVEDVEWRCHPILDAAVQS
jgi:hypothetical protein